MNIGIVVSNALKSIADAFRVNKEKQLESRVLKKARNLDRAVEAAEKYILRNNKVGRKNDKYLDKYEKLFFKYN